MLQPKEMPNLVRHNGHILALCDCDAARRTETYARPALTFLLVARLVKSADEGDVEEMFLVAGYRLPRHLNAKTHIVEFLFPDKLQIDKVIRKPGFGLRIEAVEVLESVFDVVVRRRVLHAIRPHLYGDGITCLRGGSGAQE